MKITYMTILATLAFLGFPDSTMAHPCKHHPDKSDAHCTDSGGGDGNNNLATYEAALTMGGFRFDPVVVILNKRGNIFNGTVDLFLDRDDASIDDQDAWDDVFATCALFDDENGISMTVENVQVFDTWSIDNSGGKQAGTIGSNIMVSFRDTIAGDFPEVDIDFRLIGTLPALVPELGDSIDIILTQFKFWGGVPGEDACNSGEQPLIPESTLVLTRTQ